MNGPKNGPARAQRTESTRAPDDAPSKPDQVSTVVFAPMFTTNPYQQLLIKALAPHGVRVISFDHKNARGTLERLLPLSLNCSARRAGLLHLHWPHPFSVRDSVLRTIIRSFLFLTDLLVLRLSRVPVVWTVHNVVEHDGRQPRLELLINAIAARLCHSLVVHSVTAASIVQTSYHLGPRTGRKICVIPHGRFIGVYPDEMSRDAARSRLGVADDAFVFLFFGSLRPYKGLLELIEATARLQRAEERVVLVVAGSPIDTELTSRIAERCKAASHIRLVPRHVPDHEVQVFMNGADVVVLPFRDILTSSSAVLAMSFGKAVIAPCSGGLVDLLPEDSPLTYDPGDPKGLDRAMREAVSTDIASLGAANRRSISDYTWRHAGELTAGLYSKIMARSARPTAADCS